MLTPCDHSDDERPAEVVEEQRLLAVIGRGRRHSTPKPPTTIITRPPSARVVALRRRGWQNDNQLLALSSSLSLPMSRSECVPPPTLVAVDEWTPVSACVPLSLTVEHPPLSLLPHPSAPPEKSASVECVSGGEGAIKEKPKSMRDALETLDNAQLSDMICVVARDLRLRMALFCQLRESESELLVAIKNRQQIAADHCTSCNCLLDISGGDDNAACATRGGTFRRFRLRRAVNRGAMAAPPCAQCRRYTLCCKCADGGGVVAVATTIAADDATAMDGDVAELCAVCHRRRRAEYKRREWHVLCPFSTDTFGWGKFLVLCRDAGDSSSDDEEEAVSRGSTNVLNNGDGDNEEDAENRPLHVVRYRNGVIIQRESEAVAPVMSPRARRRSDTLYRVDQHKRFPIRDAKAAIAFSTEEWQWWPEICATLELHFSYTLDAVPDSAPINFTVADVHLQSVRRRLISAMRTLSAAMVRDQRGQGDGVCGYDKSEKKFHFAHIDAAVDEIRSVLQRRSNCVRRIAAGGGGHDSPIESPTLVALRRRSRRMSVAALPVTGTALAARHYSAKDTYFELLANAVIAMVHQEVHRAPILHNDDLHHNRHHHQRYSATSAPPSARHRTQNESGGSESGAEHSSTSTSSSFVSASTSAKHAATSSHHHLNSICHQYLRRYHNFSTNYDNGEVQRLSWELSASPSDCCTFFQYDESELSLPNYFGGGFRWKCPMMPSLTDLDRAMSSGIICCEGLTPSAPNFDAIFGAEDEAAIFDTMKDNNNNNNRREVVMPVTDSGGMTVVTTTTCTIISGNSPPVVATTADMSTTTTTMTKLVQHKETTNETKRNVKPTNVIIGIPPEMPPSSMADWFVHQRPVFCIRMEQRLVEAFAGQIVRIRCAAFVKTFNASSNRAPSLKLMWFKCQRPVGGAAAAADGLRVTQRVIRHRRAPTSVATSLMLANASCDTTVAVSALEIFDCDVAQDCGEIVCVAFLENDATAKWVASDDRCGGVRVASTRLIVYDADIGGMEPAFEEPLASVPRRVHEGDFVLLKCRVSGHPQPFVLFSTMNARCQQSMRVTGQWRGDVGDEFNHKLTVVLAYLNDTWMLQINGAVTALDSGTYTVVAVNRFGKSHCRLVVRIEESGPRKFKIQAATERRPIVKNSSFASC